MRFIFENSVENDWLTEVMTERIRNKHCPYCNLDFELLKRKDGGDIYECRCNRIYVDLGSIEPRIIFKER